MTGPLVGERVRLLIDIPALPKLGNYPSTDPLPAGTLGTVVARYPADDTMYIARFGPKRDFVFFEYDLGLQIEKAT